MQGCTLIALLAIAGAAQASDSDFDGIPDDGDGSGSEFDNPCPDGVTVGCDDNCVNEPNPTQADVLAPFGVGDACQGTGTDDPVLFPSIFTAQEIDEPRYRWKGSAAAFEPAATAVNTTLPVDGGTCSFVDIAFGAPEVAYTVPPSPPFGGLACCAWEAECNLQCSDEQAEPFNDCPASIVCDVFTVAVDDCKTILYGPVDIESLTTVQRDTLGLVLQDPNGACAALADVPIDPCCFKVSRNVDFYWGTAAGSLARGADTDGDLQPDGCDNCPLDANTDQVEADGDGRGAACDSNDQHRWKCADTDGDQCDDCSSGRFDPLNDGPDPDGDGICVPEPGRLALHLAGGALLCALHVRRTRPPSST